MPGVIAARARGSVVTDHLPAGAGGQGPPGGQADTVADEPDAAVAQPDVHPAAVPAPGGTQAVAGAAGLWVVPGEVGDAVRVRPVVGQVIVVVRGAARLAGHPGVAAALVEVDAQTAAAVAVVGLRVGVDVHRLRVDLRPASHGGRLGPVTEGPLGGPDRIARAVGNVGQAGPRLGVEDP